MRSKATNFLQVIVLVSGIVYVLTGLVFYLSPLTFGRIFHIDITEDWLNGIMNDTFIAPLYFMARGFAALLFSMGLAMVLPLFDPFKYRGLIYYSGIVFPFMAALLLMKNGLLHGYGMITIYGIVFSLVLVFTAAGLYITRKDKGEGK